MGRANAECDACMCEDFVLHGVVSLSGGDPAVGATVYLQTKVLKMLTKTDSSGRFQVPGLCPDGKSKLKIMKAKFVPIVLTMPRTSLNSATINAEFVRAGKKRSRCEKLASCLSQSETPSLQCGSQASVI